MSKYKYEKVYPATIIYHSPDDQKRIEELTTENYNLKYKRSKITAEEKKAKEADKIRYEQLKKKYDNLSKLYGEVLKRLNEIQLYAPEFGTEYQKAKEEFERIQKMTI